MSLTKTWIRGTQQIDALLRLWARKWDDDPRSSIAMHASDAIACKSKSEQYFYPVHEELLTQLRKHVDVEIVDYHPEKDKISEPGRSSR
jgi:hypothetical protein